MTRIAVLGNAAGGKSTLARRLATVSGLPRLELDTLLWRPGWQPAPIDDFEKAHAEAVGGDAWIIDGLGRRESIPLRLDRATHVILIDLPVWLHVHLAAERQDAWARGGLAHPPAGIAERPPTEALLRTIAEVDRDWMPAIRTRCADLPPGRLSRIDSMEALQSFHVAAFANAARPST